MELVSFSANLITIAIVITILIIYRYLDRNNRSLEKVKRFTDKIKGDLSGFIDEKTQEMRNLSIDVQVNLKTGKEILNRINDIELELKSKAETMDKVQDRVHQYDTLIEELNHSTVLVEENLRRIHDESGFIDKVGKRVKEAAGRLDQLEKAIPSIKEEINTQNLENLSKVKNQILEGIRERINQASEEITAHEGRVKDFSTYLTHLEARRDSLSQQLVKNLESAYNNFEEKAGQRREHMAKEFQAYLAGILKDAYRKKDTYKASIDELVASADVEITSQEDRLLKCLIEFKKDVEHTEITYQQRLGKAAEDAKKFEHEVFAELKQKTNNDAAKIHNEIQKKLDGFTREVETRNNEILGILGKLKQNTEVWKAGVGKKIEKMVKDLNTKFIEGKAGIESSMQQYIKQTLDKQKCFEAETEDFLKDCRNKMQNLDIEYTNKMGEIDGDFSSFKNDYHLMLEELEKKNEEERTGLCATFEEKINGLEKKIAVRHEKVKKDFEEINRLGDDIDFRVTNIKKDLQESSCSLLQAIEEFRTEYQNKIDSTAHDVSSGVMGRIEDRLEEYERDMNYRFAKLEASNADIEELAENLKGVMAAKKEELKNDFELFIASLTEKRNEDRTAAASMMDEIKTEIADLEKEIGQLKSSSYQDVSEKLKIFEDDFFKDLKDRSETIEQTLNEWQDDVNEKIETLNGRLKSDNEEIVRRYEEKLETGLRRLSEKTDGEISEIDERIADFRQVIKQRIEEGEVEWKDTLDGAIEQYRREMTDRIETMQTELESGIDGFEDEVRGHQADFMQKTDSDYSKLKDDLDSISSRFRQFEEEVEEKTGTYFEAFDRDYGRKQEEFTAKLKDVQGEFELQIRDLREDISSAKAYVEQKKNEQLVELEKRYNHLVMNLDTIEEKQEQLDERAKIFERTEAFIDKLEGELEAFNETAERIGPEREAMISMQKEFATIKETMRDVTADIEQMSGNLRDEYKAIEEEAARNRHELKDFISDADRKIHDISKRLIEQDNELNERIHYALERFNGQYKELEQELSNMASISKEDLEKRIGSFEKTYREDHEKARQMYEKLVERIETEYRRLSEDLIEIQKQKENFVAQTKLFQRADTLKIQLRSDIDELKKDLKTIEPSRKKMNAITVEIVKVNKLADEVTSKANKYFAEKRRLESMEKNFSQLMKVADEIDTKLHDVTAASDAIQEIKLKIRELSEIGKMTESQFTRLEKKKEVIDSTTKGVDKNFRILEELEKEIKRLKESVADIPPKVLTIGQELKYLIENKPKADTAVTQLQKIDDLMNDIENRSSKLMTAREWLARTETRLESIGKNAQDQLKLLQTLMKDEGHNGGAKSRGAPAPDKRQMIIKLSRQGWAPKEIAKATSTSLGEVELILELEPKKR
ncbi:MAG: hypothetical protein JW881_10185 [Spirochaetales bacterium]|nr:hypothetical protein [Spirochaetales bacterium]